MPTPSGGAEQRATPDKETFLERAIEAEMETGRREETVEQAKRHLAWRLVRLIGGVLLVIIGLLLLVAPGPGLIVVVIGLGLLAEDVPFAKRLLDKARARLPQDDSGKISPWVLIVSGVLLVVSIGGSIWWALR